MARNKQNTAVRQASKIADVSYIIPIERAEAQENEDAIRADLVDACERLLDMHERQGWKALGYTSWREWVQQAFDLSRTRGYELLDFGRVRRNLKQLSADNSAIAEKPTRVRGKASEMGEKVSTINEAQAREIKHLPAVEQVKVWHEAVETAPDNNPTAKMVKAVVERHTQPALRQVSQRTYKAHDRVQLVTTGLVCDVVSVYSDGRISLKARAGNWRGMVSPAEIVPFGEWNKTGVTSNAPAPLKQKLEDTYLPSKRERLRQLVDEAPDDLVDHLLSIAENPLFAL